MNHLARSLLMMLGMVLSFGGCRSQADDGPGCADCSISAITLAPLGAPDGPLAIADLFTRGTVNRAGEVVLKSNYPSSLPVLDSAGALITTVGRAGSGPGEFRDVAAIAFGAGDSLFVFEWGNTRYSVFSPSYQFVSSGVLPFQPELRAVVLQDGFFLFNVGLHDSARFGQPLHRVDREGRLQLSFGSEDPEATRGVPLATSRVLTLAADGRVWTAFLTQYVLELWDPSTGQRVRRLERKVEWFPARMSVVARDAIPPAEPQATVVGVRHDAGNRAVWVLLKVPDPDWAQQVGPRTGHGYVSVNDEQGYYDTVIEVLDEETGALLASHRLPEYLTHFLGDDQVGGVIEDADGVPYLVRFRLQLRKGVTP